jgi:hypothetical protein
MKTEEIITTLLAAAAFLKGPIKDVVGQSVKDVYDSVKYYLRRKFGEGSDGAKMLELAVQKPESAMRKAALAEEAAATGIENDADLDRLIAELRSLLGDRAKPGQNVAVNGTGNHVVVAGRDVVQTVRRIERAAITPDDRHVTVEQREEIRGLIGELAVRLARDDGAPNFAAGHRMLQNRFKVASYLLVPRERFSEAVRFLKQQRAIHRSHLRRRNPAAFGRDRQRAVFSRAAALGWDRSRLFRFARERLNLGETVSSLRQLGPNQLSRLADELAREQR